MPGRSITPTTRGMRILSDGGTPMHAGCVGKGRSVCDAGRVRFGVASWCCGVLHLSHREDIPRN
nr:MAG TPA: hypothetical protein [Caudoviricetes sp.]